MRNANDAMASNMKVETTTHKGLSLVIRPVRLEDSSALWELERSLIEAESGEVRTLQDLEPDPLAFEEGLTAYTEPQAGRRTIRLVAVTTTGLVGSAQAWRFPPSRLFHVAEFSLGVSPDYQGMGVGRSLIQRVLTWAFKGEGSLTPAISRLQLQVRQDNHGAIQLYKRMGFQTEGTMRNFVMKNDGTYVDNLLMVYQGTGEFSGGST